MMIRPMGMRMPKQPTQKPQNVQFGSTNLTTEQLDTLRDELVEQFPGGPFQYSNGSGIGFLDYPKDNRIGITIFHETKADQKKVVDYLFNNNIIRKDPDGTYRYKDAMVGFKVMGRIVAL
jgi:hypothetical protein